MAKVNFGVKGIVQLGKNFILYCFLMAKPLYKKIKRRLHGVNLKKYKAEIVLTTTTIFLLTGIYYQWQGISIVKHILKQNFSPHYHLLPIAKVPIPQIIFFFILPIITIWILGETPRSYGFKIGDYKKGTMYVFASVLLLSPFLVWASKMNSFKMYYSPYLRYGLWFTIIQYFFYMICWEFLLRGYLYFGLEDRIGTLAIWVQSVPFAIAHLGKPLPETLTCYFGGLVLGYISYKTRSFFYAALIHWGIFSLLMYLVHINQ